MATFTSVKAGDWNLGDTWGNTSPGVAGTDWPGVAADIAEIYHDVRYNLVSTVQIRVNVRNNGIFNVATDMDTQFTAHATTAFYVYSGGELRIGTALNPLPKEYTCKMIHPSTSGSYDFFGANGAKLTLYGDLDYFGGIVKVNMATNWTSGQTFTVEGDLTGKWQVGHQLIVIKDGQYSAVATDCPAVTISAIALNGSNTDITISESFPGGSYSAGGYVFNAGRNIIFCRVDNPIDSSNGTNSSSEIDWDANSTMENINIQGVLFKHLREVSIYGTNTFNYNVIANTYASPTFSNVNNGLENIIFRTHIGTGNIYGSSFDGMYWFGIYSPSNLYYTTINNIIICSISSQNNAHTYSYIYGEFFKNPTTSSPVVCLTSDPGETIMGGYIGINKNGLSYWSTHNLLNLGITSRAVLKLTDAFFPSGVDKPLISYENQINYVENYIDIEAFNGDRNDPRCYGSFGRSHLVDADGTGSNPSQRLGGSERVWECVLYSNNAMWYSFLLPIDAAFLIGAGDVPTTKTIRFYIQTDYVGGIGCRISAMCNSGCKDSRGTITTRSSNSDWQYAELELPITSDGWTTLRLRIWGYELNKLIWVDPLVEVI
jgi:hypothetical protein